MELTTFLEKISSTPEQIEFEETMNVINSNYTYNPVNFTVGEKYNNAGENEGSCKIFFFAILNKLTEQQTLNLFGNYYRNEVLNDPEGDNHQNIRQFMQCGWDGIKFEDDPLD